MADVKKEKVYRDIGLDYSFMLFLILSAKKVKKQWYSTNNECSVQGLESNHDKEKQNENV